VIASAPLRHAIGLIAACLLVGVPALALSRFVPLRHEIRLASAGPATVSTAVELNGRGEITAAGRVRHRYVRLRVTDAAAATAQNEIQLLMMTSGGPPALLGGELTIADDCHYAVDVVPTVPRYGFLVFRRSSPCAPPAGTASGMLRLTTQGGARVLVRALSSPGAGPKPGLLVVDDPDVQSPVNGAALVGDFVVHDQLPPMRRLALLAYAWQATSVRVWNWLLPVLLGACVYLAIALGDLLTAAPGHRWRRALASSALIFSVCVSYALVTPPFQAPDEPNHFLGFAKLTHQPELFTATYALGHLGHVDRIRFDPTQILRPYDVGRPSTGFLEVWATPLPERTGLAWLWRACGALLSGHSVQAQLFSLRVIGALWTSLAVGLVVLMLRPGFMDRFPAVLPALTLVPMVPFLAVAFSNHVWLLGGYVLLAGAATALLLDSDRDDVWPAALLSAGIGIVVLGGHAAWPLAPMVLAIIAAARIGALQHVRLAQARFWIPVAAVVPLTLALSGREYAGVSMLSTRLAHPALIVALVALAAVGIAVAVERRLHASVSLRGVLSRRTTGVARSFAAVVTAAIATTMVWSLFTVLPRVPYVNTRDRPSVPDYVGDVLLSAATFFRGRYHDFLLSTSFWAAFGWLDTRPAGLDTLFVTASACLVVVAAWRSATTATVASLLRAGVMLAGFVAALLCYAAFSMLLSPDLHGRFLVGLYLIALVGTYGVALRVRGPADTARPLITSLTYVAWGAAHGYSLYTIVTRYF
jgi:hypothetical protein